MFKQQQNVSWTNNNGQMDMERISVTHDMLQDKATENDLQYKQVLEWGNWWYVNLRLTIEAARGPMAQGRRLSEQERSARNPTLR